jgi:multiple sugar transport system ATP-binding protein
MAQIVLEDVWKVFPDGTVAVRALNLDIADGEFMVLVGPSGCGKTTALRMVAGLEVISKGKVTIGDRIVNDMPPKERDIAMVFQNYALYPHMSVFDNMAFGLKLAKIPRPEIETRVRDAAHILGLGELLNRKPAALSGGQRQRVAMGRAIVRHPQAFLMDEPLSNLDAKLRVQTRAEIARLQRELGVTTIYVTHDQTEAMTMGDRVAVIRKGMLQQVDSPQSLYEHPVNLFVAGFIGSPAMNLMEVSLASSDGGIVVELGGFRLPVPDEVLAERPALRGYAGRNVVLGIRPEDMEDAALVADAPPERRFTSTVDLREALGSDVVVHFQVDAPPAVTEDVIELAADVDEALAAPTGAAKANVLARLNPRTTAQPGDRIEVVVDTHRLHFFDVDTGAGIYDATAPTGAPDTTATTDATGTTEPTDA